MSSLSAVATDNDFDELNERLTDSTANMQLASISIIEAQ